jgi:hypothetical protein
MTAIVSMTASAFNESFPFIMILLAFETEWGDPGESPL